MRSSGGAAFQVLGWRPSRRGPTAVVSLDAAARNTCRKVVVVGGGAAGFFAAIRAAELRGDYGVTILEAGPEVLWKVRISGGGRCNVTHACFEPARLVEAYPRGGRELRGPFSRFQPRDTVEWFESRGVKLKAEADGRMFPTTDDSGTIAGCLERAASRAGVRVLTRTPVSSVARRDDGGFSVRPKRGDPIDCDLLMLATGSSPPGYRFAESLGHTIVPPVPSLFTFKVKDARIEGLAGLSVPAARLSLAPEGGPSKRPPPGLSQAGPLLITHWGLSGPAVLRCSAWGARALAESGYRARLTVDWVGDRAALDDVARFLAQARQLSPKKAVRSFCPGPLELPQRLWARLCDAAGAAEGATWAQLPGPVQAALASQVKASVFEVAGKGEFKDEFVTAGGIALGEVDLRRFESKRSPGLFAAGELLDIDGVTGGFNFQSAWTGGFLAGTAMAEYDFAARGAAGA
eukprot:tig00020903_g15126.t1